MLHFALLEHRSGSVAVLLVVVVLAPSSCFCVAVYYGQFCKKKSSFPPCNFPIRLFLEKLVAPSSCFVVDLREAVFSGPYHANYIRW